MKFLQFFIKLYDKCFPTRKIKVKSKRILTHLITSGIAKSSKSKQKLYEKLLKYLIPTNEVNYETYKILFETIKQYSKKKN